MADHTELAAELKSWCRGEGLEEAKALLVLVPEEVEIAQIEETLETIKCLGRVRVRGHLFHTPLSCLMVLCECKQSIPKDNAPKEVLDHLLDTEGRTMEDIYKSVLQVVGDFLEKAHKPQAEGGYWRLRLFSGNLPVPPSEDPFDHWLEQAWLMVEERDCTDKEKRHRLMESLKGPAPRGRSPTTKALTKVSKPPTFLHLLSEIRTEEECEASRRKLNTSVQFNSIQFNFIYIAPNHNISRLKTLQSSMYRQNLQGLAIQNTKSQS
uniref:Uncharacterized protein n=1 Tax=Pundamilia nyererei TaxID=303518 RepID=A0A3B4FMQ1_9CICH